jgi:hypothetical protein
MRIAVPDWEGGSAQTSSRASIESANSLTPISSSVEKHGALHSIDFPTPSSFLLKDDAIVAFGCIHGAREPEHWERRVPPEGPQ